MGQEIERKYVVYRIPEEVEINDTKLIHQTYLSVGEEEIRVRKIRNADNWTYKMTIKKGQGLVREEIELEIAKETYEQLLKSGYRRPLIKTRGNIDMQGHLCELDVYHNAENHLLIIAEVEFESESAAEAFVQPSWFGEEVTDDSNYKNQSLWKAIQPNKSKEV